MECIELSMKSKAKKSDVVVENGSTEETVPNGVKIESAASPTPNSEYETQIANLEAENRVLLAQITAITASQQQKQQEEVNDGQTTTTTTTTTTNADSLTIMGTVNESAETGELRQKLEASERVVETLREQVRDLGLKLTEMTGLYEGAKQAELDEKNKIKHLERSVRALKIEKGRN